MMMNLLASRPIASSPKFTPALDEAELVRNELHLNWLRLLLFAGIVVFEFCYWIFSVGLDAFLAAPEFVRTLLVFLVIPARLVFFFGAYKRGATSQRVLLLSTAFLAVDHAVWVLLASQGPSDAIRLFIQYLFLSPYTIITHVSLNPAYSVTSAGFGIAAFATAVLPRILSFEGQARLEWGIVSLILGFMLFVNALVTLYLSRYNLRRYRQMQEFQLSLTKQRDKLKHSEELTRSLYARVSHDLRTPLHGVIGMAGLLQESGPSEEQEEFISGIRGSAESLLGLINNILDKAKIDAGYFLPEMRIFSLPETLTLVGRSVRHSIGNSSITFQVLLAPGVPEFLIGDQTRLLQILFNLLGNAVKFTSSGNITLNVRPRLADTSSTEVEPEESREAENSEKKEPSLFRLQFIVKDDGVGMPSDMLETIFEEFRQINPRDRIRGAGLGLAITKELVTLLGGNIAVQSELGRGSVFTFCLPFEVPPRPGSRRAGEQLTLFAGGGAGISGAGSASVEDVTGAGQTPAEALRTTRVLVVDDSAVNRQILERMVQKAGGIAFAAESGELALERLAVERFDLVLLDYEMPGIHGLDVIEAYRSGHGLGPAAAGEGPAVPRFVLVTGHGKELFQVMNLPAEVEIIEKPVRLSQIRELLTSLQTRGTQA